MAGNMLFLTETLTEAFKLRSSEWSNEGSCLSSLLLAQFLTPMSQQQQSKSEISVEERIKTLETFSFEDNQPNIEAPSLAISLEPSLGYKYVDKSVFEFRWSEEISFLAQLDETLKNGRDYVSVLYTYRSCSKTFPQVKDNNQSKEEYYAKQIEVLEPEVNKLLELMHYHEKAIHLFCSIITSYANNTKKPSEIVMWKLMELVDLLSLLDDLKNMKACLSGDLSFYRRALGFKKKDAFGQNESRQQELNILHLFLAHHWSISTKLKESLKDIVGYEDVLCAILNMCADYFETERYITPSERYALLRTMPYFIFLMDGDDEKHTLARIKHLHLDRFQRIFKRWPVVPLYGDMQTTLTHILKRMKNYDERMWATDKISEAKLATEYEIIHRIEELREIHNSFLARWMLTMHEVKLFVQQGKDPPNQLAKDVVALVIQGFRLLSDWTSRIMAQAAWKYSRPNNSGNVTTNATSGDANAPPSSGPSISNQTAQQNKPQTNVPNNTNNPSSPSSPRGLDANGPVSSNNDEARKEDTTTYYERVIKLNYTIEEKYALVELIAMIKGLAKTMLEEDALLASILRRHFHEEIQEVVQNGMREIIAKVAKSNKPKKKPVKDELLSLRFLLADWYSAAEPPDPALEGKKDVTKFTIPTRVVPPSPTQLDMFRIMIWGFLTFRGKKQLYSDKDFSGTPLKVLDDFYTRSFFYKYLLNYAATIRECTDLGDLWYREFYLELSNRIQFPIDMSLAWLLTDNILEGPNTVMTEYVFFPLDIYNDAAYRALYDLRSQFLYDEIEAETNLAFEQLVYKLSQKCYDYFRLKASSIQMDKAYKQQFEVYFADKMFRLYVPRSRWDVILQQRHLQLLGRSIDLNALIAQRINAMIRRSIDWAITNFEASDITAVIELETHLTHLKLTHQLLSKYLPIDPWESIFSEVNESVSLVSFHGRIVLHVIFQLTLDLAPNFVYNTITQRFVRAPHCFTEPVLRISKPQPDPNSFGNKLTTTAFVAALQLTKEWFGLQHVKAILRLIGKETLSLVLSEILQNMKLKLPNVLYPYVKELMGGFPPKTNLPIYDYGIDGGFGYFSLKLKLISEYPDLIPQVFQHFREWGNSIVILNLFDIALQSLNTSTLITSAPFLGIVPNDKKLYSTYKTPSPFLKVLQNLKEILDKRKGVAKSPQAAAELVNIAPKIDELYRPFEESTSIFTAALNEINLMLDPFRKEWGGFPDNPQQQPDNNIIPIEQSFEFYRLWSGFQFVFLTDIQDNVNFKKSSQELFGDGWHWAGCTIIYFLRQRNRFEAFDFAYHVSRLFELFSTKDKSISVFFARLTIVKDLNTSIFRTLEAFFPLSPQPDVTIKPPETEASSIFLYTSLSPPSSASSSSPTTTTTTTTTSSGPPPKSTTQSSTSKAPTSKTEADPSSKLLAPESRAEKHISLREVPSEKTRKGSTSKTHASQRMNPVTKEKLKEEKKEKQKERRPGRESKSSHDTERHRESTVGVNHETPSNASAKEPPKTPSQESKEPDLPPPPPPPPPPPEEQPPPPPPLPPNPETTESLPRAVTSPPQTLTGTTTTTPSESSSIPKSTTSENLPLPPLPSTLPPPTLVTTTTTSTSTTSPTTPTSKPTNSTTSSSESLTPKSPKQSDVSQNQQSGTGTGTSSSVTPPPLPTTAPPPLPKSTPPSIATITRGGGDGTNRLKGPATASLPVNAAPPKPKVVAKGPGPATVKISPKQPLSSGPGPSPGPSSMTLPSGTSKISRPLPQPKK